MSAFFRKRGTQRGAALIVMMTVIVMGIAWYTVGALGKAVRSTADREIRTGAALSAARRALLDYVAAQAAQPDTTIPGRLPCPEPLSAAAGSEGIAAGCSDNTATYVGRLPWRTLGVDQIRDGDGELLWYVLGRGFRQSPINFGSRDEIELDGVDRQAVAMIIAPGAALNTTSEAGTPPANCPRVNQQPRSVTAPFDPAAFLECGRATTPAPGNEPQYKTDKTSPWTNDRIVTITAAELMDAIAGPVGDRLQRQVAALLGDWHQVEFTATGRSWGNTYGFNYLPFASDWNNPSGGDFCANLGQDDGLAPVDTTCTAYDNKWSGSVTSLLGDLIQLGGCSDQGTYLRCRFWRIPGASLLLGATITVSTNNVGHAFRSTIAASDLVITGGGSATISMTLNAASDVTATINVSWPLGLGLFSPVEVRIPHLQNAAVLSDPRYTWFWNNKWHEYTYYAIAPTAMPPGNASCTPGTNCLTVFGLPAVTGATNDKRLALVLSGRPISGQTQPSGARSDYFELENRTTGDREYQASTISTTFNDRVAVCPFSYPKQSGPALTICN